MKTPTAREGARAATNQPEAMPGGAIASLGAIAPTGGDRSAQPSDAVLIALPEICALIKRRTSHDFSRYKQNTLARRVSRRMGILGIPSVALYRERLLHDPKEVENLFNDLLIGVTQFFRDPEAFETLAAKVIPQLFKRPKSAGPIRIWVSGCATGEEAYSLAILLTEYAAKQKLPLNAQIFATDLDGEALDVARKGRYPESSLENISDERRKLYFLKQKGSYEVRKEVRELCIFSPHSLVKDPPFSRLDLISCRNLLIYFETDLQKRLLPLFHFALNPGGCLFLGPSENIAVRSELFQAIDTKNRIFQRKGTLLNAAVHPPNLDRTPLIPMHAVSSQPATPSKDHTTVRTIERVLLEEYSPASVVINEHGDALFFTGHTGRYLQPQAGAPTTKVLDLARGNLRLELRTALQQAFSTRQEVARRNVDVKVGPFEVHVDLVVRPLLELGRDAGLFIVVFQEVPAPTDRTQSVESLSEAERNVIHQLESELRTTREDLQTTIEELETSNEELKSANEELLSMNEELQSTNEELQTSKEEIQSINDELQRKMEELDSAHNDLQNFFESTQVPTLFLDDHLRIKKFTSALNPICRLTFADIGKPLFEAAPNCIHPELGKYIEDVLAKGETREREISIKGKDTRWYLMRVAAYRGIGGAIQGVVITFPDITEMRRNQEQSALLAAIVEGSQDGVIGKSMDGIITSWNPAAARMYGYSAEQAIGKPVTMLSAPGRAAEIPPLFERIRKGERIRAFETERITRDGRVLSISLTLSPIYNDRGEVIGVSGIDRDITGEKVAQERQARLAAIVDSSDDAIIGKTLDGIITTWNGAAERIFGYMAEEMVGHSIMAIIPPDKRQEELNILSQLRSGTGVQRYETARLRKDGRRIDVSLTSSPIRNERGQVVGGSTIARDVTDQKLAEAALRDAQKRLQDHAHELERLVSERTANLEETVESLEGVCYTIAHDLRAPLRAVQSFTQVLMEDYASKFDAEGQRFGQRIVAAASRMDTLINDLLAYAKLSHSDLPVAPINLNDELRRITDQLNAEITTQNGEVIARDAMPTVMAHQVVLDQVFANLITNSLKFVAPGVKPRIEISAERLDDSTARIIVEDNGIGIPAEHRERVFGLFQRLHHEEFPGTGVGLAIVRKGIERMGGRVNIESPGQSGTRFVLELPLAKVDSK